MMHFAKFMILAGLGITPATAVFVSAHAENYEITLKDHVFSPPELVVPADQKITIMINNLDDTTAEFESFDLNREKIINGMSEIKIIVGPLSPGSYEYYDDFHRDSSLAKIIAK